MNQRLLAVLICGIIFMVTLTTIIITVFVIAGVTDSKHDRSLIVISLDGFKPDYLSQNDTPFLWSLREQGAFGKMRPMFTSETFPNHMSIATGLYEESHGVVSNSMYDPEFGEFFNKYNTSPLWWDNGYSKPIWVSRGKLGLWPAILIDT